MPYDTEPEMSGCAFSIFILIALALFLLIKNSPRIEYVVDKEIPYVVVYYTDGNYTYSVNGDSIKQYDNHFVVYDKDSLELYQKIVRIEYKKDIKYKEAQTK